MVVICPVHLKFVYSLQNLQAFKGSLFEGIKDFLKRLESHKHRCKRMAHFVHCPIPPPPPPPLSSDAISKRGFERTFLTVETVGGTSLGDGT
jgi:hypothetical protein